MSDEDKRTRRVTPASSLPRNVTFERSQHPDALAAKPSDYARRLSPAAESGPPTKATVANGKTLHMPHPTEKMCVGYDVEQKANILVPRIAVYGPGVEVELPLSEVHRLKRLGFLVDTEDYQPPPMPPENERKFFGPREAS